MYETMPIVIFPIIDFPEAKLKVHQISIVLDA